ncbi:MAG: hypothetical protein IPP01_09730 [Saprospiraceae bacterium]|nr:hypothetical protein [Saprospiraceae bacterium]
MGIEELIKKAMENEHLKAVSNMTKKGFSDKDIIEILDITKDRLNLLKKKLGIE